jgi:peptide chain release factor 1
MALSPEILKRAQTLEQRYDELERLLGSPDVATDMERLKDFSREFSDIAGSVRALRALRETQQKHASAASAVEAETDEEMRGLYCEEMQALEAATATYETAITEYFVPSQGESDRSVIIEIRAGAGGNEAALFAGDLHRMYCRFAENSGWRAEDLSISASALGGFKEIVFAVRGRGAFNALRFESGVHRVQRIPVTESGGRIHTSTSTVAVLTEPDDVEVKIEPADLRIDTFRASSAGGQHVNKTDSAVRITHVPTGLVVECQDERSQHQNRVKAMRLLRARLLQKLQEEQQAKISADRRNQVGTGDRSERIRTYNFAQNRVTDHRIGLTLHKLALILEGDMGELVNALKEKAHELEAAGPG